jgi:hypothetical protein
LLPGPIIPDGQGGILATWTISPSNPPVPKYPYQVADVFSGVVGAPYNLPFSPTTVHFEQSPTIVLGDNGIAFASDGTNTSNGPQSYPSILFLVHSTGAIRRRPNTVFH